MLTLLVFFVVLMIVVSLASRATRRSMERRQREQEELLRRMEEDGGASPFAGPPLGPLFESPLFGTGAHFEEALARVRSGRPAHAVAS